MTRIGSAGAALLPLLLAMPAWADDGIAPLKMEIADGWTFHLAGTANLTGFTASQSGGEDTVRGTASVFAAPKVEKLLSNGWRIGLRSEFDLYHDRLSGDNYGNDFVTKAYLFADTPYGRLEIGQQDGAAYSMAVTGPLVAPAAAIDDANITFFTDPVTGTPLTDMFGLRTAVFGSGNDAKIALYSPRIVGVQIGVSYTPELTKGVLPFATHAPHVADRQDNVIDAAINYTGYFGATSLGAYAGLSAAQNAQRSAGHDDLFDWAIGAEVDHDFGGTTLAVGGAYRQSNAYTFDPYSAFKHGTTHAVHASTTVSRGAWSAGLEYSRGAADAEGAMPALDLSGYELSAAYELTSNVQITAGWQHLRFERGSGTFYTGSRTLDMDAGFLYLRLHV